MKKRTAPKPDVRILDNVLLFRTLFSVVAIVWLVVGIGFFVVVGAYVISAWAAKLPLAISSDIKWLIGLSTSLQGLGAWIVIRVVKFYFPASAASS